MCVGDAKPLELPVPVTPGPEGAADVHLELQCVVEVVETTQQLQALPPWASGQGYLLGRPGAVAAGSAAIETGSAQLWPARSVPAGARQLTA